MKLYVAPLPSPTGSGLSDLYRYILIPDLRKFKVEKII